MISTLQQDDYVVVFRLSLNRHRLALFLPEVASPCGIRGSWRVTVDVVVVCGNAVELA